MRPLGWPMLVLLTAGSACSLILDPSALLGPSPRADGGGGGDSGGDAASVGSRYVSAVLADGPEAYFRLDELEGPARSEVGSFVATPIGSPTFGVAGALSGSAAFSPNGAGGLDLGPFFDFVDSQAFSFELWVSFSAVDENFRFIFTKSIGTASARQAYGAYVRLNPDGAKLVFERYVDGESRLVITGVPSLDEYHHLVMTFDGTALQVWVDGASRGATPDSREARSKSTPLLVGSPRVDEELKPVLGSIDELAIYSRALTPAQVKAHFDAAPR